MSLLDSIRKFFNPTPEEKADKLKEKITNMYGQSPDRVYYLDQLAAMGPELAPSRLIMRFTCHCDNGTYDADEKEHTKNLLLSIGEPSIEPLKKFLRTHDKDFNWPYRTLSELINHKDLVDFVVELLNTIGPDYVRNPERKEQLILIVKSFDEDEVGRAVLPYLGDDNETIRFVAADAVISKAKDYGIAALAKRFAEEQSQRVLTLICDAFKTNAWVVPEEDREKVSANLPAGTKLNDKGIIVG